MTPPCPERPQVDAHFQARLSPQAEHRLRLHLPGCESCRSRYDQQLLLAQLDPTALSASERLGRGLGFRTAPASAGIPAGLWQGALAALLLVGFSTLLLRTSAPGFTSRGGPLPTASETLQVYRLSPGPERVQGKLRAGDELAFTYVNPGPARYLMVLGVDEHRHIHWYYPRWVDPAQDPEAVTIEPSSSPRELPDAVAQRLDGQKLTVYALFLEQPLHVKEIEAQVAQAADPLSLSVPKARLQALPFSVLP